MKNKIGAQERIFGVLLIAVLAMAAWISRETVEYVHSSAALRKKAISDNGVRKIKVVVDAGHGGQDPGKVGVNGALEKDVNLEIAKILKSYLELEGVEVILTRDSDEGLYDADASNKKVQDLKRRIAIIEETQPDITVSIHQNSYPEEYVHGAQVFYYTGSKEGQRLADKLQSSLTDRLDPENHRQIKPNDSYYLLKKTTTPIVIVECGFLSNGEEAEKLCTPEYQKRAAWAIHIGILQYLKESLSF